MTYHHNLEIKSVVGALPLNFELNSREGIEIFGQEIKKIITLTGVDKRHIANQNTSVLDLAVSAIKRIISLNKIDLNKIVAVIYVTFTFENRLPGDVNKLINVIGLPKTTLGLDLSSACSGFLNGFFVASTILNSLPDDSIVLLVDGDVQSKFVSKKDRSTYPVLADASTVTLLKKGKKTNPINFLSLGEGQNELCIKGFSSKRYTQLSDFELNSTDNVNYLNNFNIYMNGISIYNFVVNHVIPLIKNFKDGLNDSFDFFIPHQANEFITKTIAKKIDLSDKLLISSNEFGNVGSASIPLTIARHVPNNSGKSFNLLLSGFGAGLAANVSIIQTSPDIICDIIYV